MNKTIFLFIITLLPLTSQANYIENVLFAKSVLTIQHSGCHLKQSIEEKNKLILILDNCQTTSGELAILHPNITDIHWAQHDKTTVWLVITFLSNYKFEINLSRYQYKICLPICEKSNWLLKINGILLQIPVQNMSINEFLDNSIGFLPKHLVKDGLPHFGSKRDDWQGKIRSHNGYDIYVNNVNVVATAYGRVTKVKQSERAGLYIKLHHETQFDTIYVHLKKALVIEGQTVNVGDVIGKIDGAVGNAIAPQLHFEIKSNDKSIDPLPLIEKFYQKDRSILDKIRKYKKLLIKNIRVRDIQVKTFIDSK